MSVTYEDFCRTFTFTAVNAASDMQEVIYYFEMNRLTVYSYLTRYTKGNIRYGKLLTEPVDE